jgi:hypothetical protein
MPGSSSSGGGSGSGGGGGGAGGVLPTAASDRGDVPEAGVLVARQTSVDNNTDVAAAAGVVREEAKGTRTGNVGLFQNPLLRLASDVLLIWVELGSSTHFGEGWQNDLRIRLDLDVSIDCGV